MLGNALQLYTEVKTNVPISLTGKMEELAKTHRPFILVAEHIFPVVKEALRQKSVSYLDAAGNIFLTTGDLYTDVTQ